MGRRRKTIEKWRRETEPSVAQRFDAPVDAGATVLVAGVETSA
jgi:hypothetical protein